jgi:hypothetical protein
MKQYINIGELYISKIDGALCMSNWIIRNLPEGFTIDGLTKLYLEQKRKKMMERVPNWPFYEYLEVR